MTLCLIWCIMPSRALLFSRNRPFSQTPRCPGIFVKMTKETPSMMMETLPSGTVLHGRYRIERVLGSGGFGHVYLAVDLQTNQQYAIKEYLVTGSSGKAQLE